MGSLQVRMNPGKSLQLCRDKLDVGKTGRGKVWVLGET